MAEAIARHLGHDSSSAGTDPPEDRVVAKNALEVLEEMGIDTSELYPKSVDSVDSEGFEMIISMGCGVSCPTIPIDSDWGLEDPLGEPIEAYRRARDEIRSRIEELSLLHTDA